MQKNNIASSHILILIHIETKHAQNVHVILSTTFASSYFGIQYILDLCCEINTTAVVNSYDVRALNVCEKTKQKC